MPALQLDKQQPGKAQTLSTPLQVAQGPGGGSHLDPPTQAPQLGQETPIDKTGERGPQQNQEGSLRTHGSFSTRPSCGYVNVLLQNNFRCTEGHRDTREGRLHKPPPVPHGDHPTRSGCIGHSRGPHIIPSITGAAPHLDLTSLSYFPSCPESHPEEHTTPGLPSRRVPLPWDCSDCPQG